MIATKGLLTVDEQITVLKLAKEKLKCQATVDFCPGLCIIIHNTAFELYAEEKCLKSFFNLTVEMFVPSFSYENALKSNTNCIMPPQKMYWYSRKLEEGSVANRLAFLDWLINELEKSKTIK